MSIKSKSIIYAILNSGALGDIIATLPTLKVLHERGQIEKIIIFPRFFDLFKLYFPEEILFDINNNKTTKDDAGNEVNILNFEAKKYPIMSLNNEKNSIITSLCVHLVDIATLNLTGCILPQHLKSYPLVDYKLLPKNKVKSKKYVVLTYGSTNKLRKMMPYVFNRIKNYCLSKGYDVVVIGTTKHELTYSDGAVVNPDYKGADFKGCINLIDKTTLPEAIAVIKDAKCLIGLDNGLIHLGALTKTKIVVGYTMVGPEYRLPIRDGKLGKDCFVVEPTSKCRYCETSMLVLLDICFTKCNNENSSEECVKSLNADVWIKQIKQVLR